MRQLRSCRESMTRRSLRAQTHAIMGTNGSGKSTLSKCLVGHPDYTVTAGTGVHSSSAFGVEVQRCLRVVWLLE